MTSCIMETNYKAHTKGMPSIIYKTKSKLMKKIRRHLESKSCNDNAVAAANLPPITFHSNHGENVRLLREGAVARREEGFCKGVAFSNRTIRINEKVFLKITETSASWSGVLRFGFTNVDPTTMQGQLPKFACPDMTNKPGYWAKALAERYAEKDVVLFYYVTSNGDVHFGINGKEKGVFFSGVNTREPLWALFDIYGNTTAIEILGTYNSLSSFTQTNLQRLKVVHNKLNKD